MKTINFFDANRNLIMQFTNFHFNQDEVLQIVNFTGIVNFDFFHLETNFEAEEFDLKNFLLSLEKIYNGKQKVASFNPLSPKIRIKLSEELGHILVKVEICNDLYTGKFEFEYTIDQSFIPELIEEIETVIKEIRMAD